ncbi:MAG: TetR/AcrR family transcriptional regulator [Acidimicrobiales bacterium]
MSDTHSTAQLILAAARRQFSAQGYDATSVAGIAREVGVVEGAVYRHFSSKRDLLQSVIRSFYEPLIDDARAGAAAIDAPRDRLRFLIRRQLRAINDDPELCRLIISEARSFDDYYESEVADLSRTYTGLVVAAVADGVARGHFRDDVPADMIRDVIYGGIEHMAWSALSGHGHIDPDTVATHLMAIVCVGIDNPDPSGDGMADGLERLDAVVDRLDAALGELTEAGSR